MLYVMLLNTVSPLTIIDPQSINQTYHRNDTANLVCASSGGPNNAFQWQANDTDITGETMENLTLTNVNASTGGMYTCVVTNAAGSDYDSTFLFIAPYFTTEPISVETSDASSVTLLCVAEAFPDPSYLWSRADDVPTRGAVANDTNTLVFSPVFFGDEGDYYCNATSREAVARSQDVTLTGENIAKSWVYMLLACIAQFTIAVSCTCMLKGILSLYSSISGL